MKVRSHSENSAIIRVSVIYGPWDSVGNDRLSAEASEEGSGSLLVGVKHWGFNPAP